MTTAIATVTAKGQITIPKTIRHALAIAEKDRLIFQIEGDHLLVMPVHRRPVTQLYGSLPATRPSHDLQAIREKIRFELGERIDRGEE